MQFTINGKIRFINENVDWETSWCKCPACEDGWFIYKMTWEWEGDEKKYYEEYKCDTCGRVFEVANVVFKEKIGEEIKNKVW